MVSKRALTFIFILNNVIRYFIVIYFIYCNVQVGELCYDISYPEKVFYSLWMDKFSVARG